MIEITMDAQPPKSAEKVKIVEDWAKQLQMAVIGCAVYFDGRSEQADPSSGEDAFYRLLANKLRSSLSTCVALHAQAYTDWSADLKNVGFMVRIDGASFMRAPVHLVPLIPEDRFASMVWKLSNEVRLSKNSIVALSGSNAVRRIFEYVDDVDFFEYVPETLEQVQERLHERISSNGTMVCEKVKLGSEVLSAPFDKTNTESIVESLLHGREPNLTLKLDYLTFIVEDRPFEVSNISAFVDSNFQGDAKQSTFPFQEILVSQKEIVPTQLDDPMKVGEYICWLISEIEEYGSAGNHIKAAKRALNLARFCWFDDILNDFHFLFDNTVAVHDAEIHATKNALERIKNGDVYCNGLQISDVEDRLSLLAAERGTKEVKQRKFFPSGFEQSAEKLISQLLARISDLSGGSVGNA